MTVKARAITLPKGTLVSIERRPTIAKDGNRLERVYFLDVNDNGLDAGDRIYEFYYVTKRGKRVGSAIFGNETFLPRTEIRERSLTAKDIRRYKSAFKRRFKKLVKTARAHRASAKKIPRITKGRCGAYWKIIKSRGASTPLLPLEKAVKFKPAIALSTKVLKNGLRNPRVLYNPNNPKPVDPRRCAYFNAKSSIKLSGRVLPIKVTVSAGGISTYPIWMRELFNTNHFKSNYPGYIQQVGVDYLLGGNQYIHLALNDPARVAYVW